MARQPLSALALGEILDRASKYEQMASTASTLETKRSLEILAARYIELAGKRVAELAERDAQFAAAKGVQSPGEVAIRSGAQGRRGK